jgi:hypothetical protein
MDVRSRRISSTHAWRGKQLRSEIFSSGEVELWVGTNRSGVVGLGAAVLTITAACFLGFPAAGLGAAVDLGSGFLGLAVFLVAVTLGCSGTSVNG